MTHRRPVRNWEIERDTQSNFTVLCVSDMLMWMRVCLHKSTRTFEYTRRRCRRTTFSYILRYVHTYDHTHTHTHEKILRFLLEFYTLDLLVLTHLNFVSYRATQPPRSRMRPGWRMFARVCVCVFRNIHTGAATFVIWLCVCTLALAKDNIKFCLSSKQHTLSK